MAYKLFREGQKVQVEAFEDLPRYKGTITDTGSDYVSLLVTDKPNIPETYAEIYEDQFHLITVIGDTDDK